MNNIPEKIYLQKRTLNNSGFKVNWNTERQSDTDIEYVLSKPVEQDESRQDIRREIMGVLIGHFNDIILNEKLQEIADDLFKIFPQQPAPSLQKDKINLEDEVIKEISEYMDDLDKHFDKQEESQDDL